jgi:hypothetical protein
LGDLAHIVLSFRKMYRNSRVTLLTILLCAGLSFSTQACEPVLPLMQVVGGPIFSKLFPVRSAGSGSPQDGGIFVLSEEPEF